MSDDEVGQEENAAAHAGRTEFSRADLAVTCPFMRTLVVTRPDLYDDSGRTMSRDVLLGFVRAQRSPEERGDLEDVFEFFARVNQTPFTRWVRNVMSRSDLFSTDFPGSKGDHSGSTGIYRERDGTFDETAFRRVINHSSDGTTMTRQDMASAIIEANGREELRGSTLDLAKSAGEFALLFNLLGPDDGAMRISDMRMLCDKNQWPPDALRNLGTATRHQWNTTTREIMRRIIELKFPDDDNEPKLERAMRDIQTVMGGPSEK